MSEQITAQNNMKEIIGHSGSDPITRVSAKLQWREEEGLWYQAFCFAGEDWGCFTPIAANLPYDTLLKHFNLLEHKDKLHFGKIAHSSPEQLKKLQTEKYPRLKPGEKVL